MDIWETKSADLIDFENRIEFHNPDGHTYVARTFGTEVLYGKTVQKGIGARVLEYANDLLQKGVVTEPILNKAGVVIGHRAKLDLAGKVQYKSPTGAILAAPNDQCAHSKDCLKMQNYTAVPKLMNEAMFRFGWTRNSRDLKGVY